jgi:hypothetical protein
MILYELCDYVCVCTFLYPLYSVIFNFKNNLLSYLTSTPPLLHSLLAGAEGVHEVAHVSSRGAPSPGRRRRLPRRDDAAGLDHGLLRRVLPLHALPGGGVVVVAPEDSLGELLRDGQTGLGRADESFGDAVLAGDVGGGGEDVVRRGSGGGGGSGGRGGGGHLGGQAGHVSRGVLAAPLAGLHGALEVGNLLGVQLVLLPAQTKASAVALVRGDLPIPPVPPPPPVVLVLLVLLLILFFIFLLVFFLILFLRIFLVFLSFFGSVVTAAFRV